MSSNDESWGNDGRDPRLEDYRDLKDTLLSAMSSLRTQALPQNLWKECTKIIEDMSHAIALGQVHSASEFVRLSEDAQSAGSGTRLKTKTPVDELAQHLGVSKAEIKRRLSVADAMRDRVNEHLESIGPKYPLVADIFMNGETSIGTASTMIKELDKAQVVAEASPQLDTQVVAQEMESALIEAQRVGGSPLVHSVAKNWMNRLDSKDVVPTPELLRELQGLHLTGKKYGLNHGVFYLDDEQWATILAGSTFEANPRIKNVGTKNIPGGLRSDSSQGVFLNGSGQAVIESGGLTADGTEVPAPDGLVDKRTRPQKLADGLCRTVRLGLASNKLPINGGYRPQVMVTIDHETLAGRLAEKSAFACHSAQVGPIDPGIIRRLACEANILPVVLNGVGRVLDVGEPQRLFTSEQRKILYARDRGCTAPGCEVPADGCEAHHVKEWSEGGPTTIDNGALVCHYHHKLVHDTEWSIDIRQGVPYWIPPKSVDVNQIPIRNPYFHLGLGSMSSKQS